MQSAMAGRQRLRLIRVIAGVAVGLGGLQVGGGAAWAQDKGAPEKGAPVTFNRGGTIEGAKVASQPAGQPGSPLTPMSEVGDDGEMVMLDAYREPLQLSALVDLVAKTLGINVTIQGDLPGTVVFNAPVPVRKNDLLGLLDSLLEQQGFAMSQDRFGFYTIHTQAQTPSRLGSERPTTRIVSTPNVRPSALKAAIEAQVGVMANGRSYAYVDELGVIVMTDTPRRLSTAEDLVLRLLEQYNKAQFTRMELTHVAASVARDRVLSLIGQGGSSVGGSPEQIQQRGGVPGEALPPPAIRVNNLGDRLTVDAQGNALIFRGLTEEIEQVRRVLSVIDVPNALVPRKYDAGTASAQIADIARGQGLGEVITIEQTGANLAQLNFEGGPARSNRQGAGGPVMVVDPTNGTIVYYGTPAQQDQLAALIETLDVGAEKVVIGVYKLKNSNAEDVAEVVLGLIQNTTPVGTSPLLPGGQGFSPPTARMRQNQQARTTTRNINQPSTSEGDLSLEGGNAFVIADVANNQILVKAPAGQQREFERLIERLDLRRPQVYLEAQIVSVTWSDDLRLAFETQLINANGTGGVLNTNFGLSSFGTGGALTNRKSVATGLGGLTAAVIRSDQVPIIINALASESNARVLSSPKLLVDDNEEATIVSLDQQPTSTVSRTSNTADLVTAGDYAEAGTTLTITPQISGANYLRLKYEIELSSFTGRSTTTGGTTLPPPKLKNTINSESVTIPSDSTIIVGGLSVDSMTKTIAKVPLLGDIPLVGILFQDRSDSNRRTNLYVFITPRIMRDPNFADLMLLTRGPAARAKVTADLPELEATLIEVTPVTALPPTGGQVGGEVRSAPR